MLYILGLIVLASYSRLSGDWWKSRKKVHYFKRHRKNLISPATKQKPQRRKRQYPERENSMDKAHSILSKVVNFPHSY